MLSFILGIIFGVLIIISIVVYYKKIKRFRKVAEIVFINRSVLCLILTIVNKLFKKRFEAITNLFNDRVHIVSFNYFDKISEEDILYKHELVHVLQCKKHKRLIFIVLYLISSIRYGYSKNPFEIEAYTFESSDISEIKKHFGF